MPGPTLPPRDTCSVTHRGTHAGCGETWRLLGNRLCEPSKPSYWHGYASSKPHPCNCFTAPKSLLKTLALYEIVSWLPTLAINLQEGTRPKSDRRKAGWEKCFQKAFVGKIKDLGTSFPSAELCSAGCLTRLFTRRHKSRWHATKGHGSCREL